jgi:hypothetical protein
MSHPATRPRFRPSGSPPAYLVRLGVGLAVLASILAFAVRAQAQQAGPSPITLRPIVGALVGTGAQREALKNALLVGAQATYTMHPNVAMVGTFSWSPNQNKLSVQRPKLDLYQYDVGLEGRFNDLTRRSPVITRPYATFGAGARTYDPRNVPNAEAQSNPLLYGAAGLDLEHADGGFGLRLEVRDNVTWFKGFRGELPEIQARNDLQLSAGLTFGI